MIRGNTWGITLKSGSVTVRQRGDGCFSARVWGADGLSHHSPAAGWNAASAGQPGFTQPPGRSSEKRPSSGAAVLSQSWLVWTTLLSDEVAAWVCTVIPVGDTSSVFIRTIGRGWASFSNCFISIVNEKHCKLHQQRKNAETIVISRCRHPPVPGSMPPFLKSLMIPRADGVQKASHLLHAAGLRWEKGQEAAAASSWNGPQDSGEKAAASHVTFIGTGTSEMLVSANSYLDPGSRLKFPQRWGLWKEEVLAASDVLFSCFGNRV
ncbi:hypothetical protein CB1_000237001 [Camelus ferus]|nr:hypothetical protein CB1_000237001 [Camelus ferus]